MHAYTCTPPCPLRVLRALSNATSAFADRRPPRQDRQLCKGHLWMCTCASARVGIFQHQYNGMAQYQWQNSTQVQRRLLGTRYLPYLNFHMVDLWSSLCKFSKSLGTHSPRFCSSRSFLPALCACKKGTKNIRLPPSPINGRPPSHHKRSHASEHAARAGKQMKLHWHNAENASTGFRFSELQHALAFSAATEMRLHVSTCPSSSFAFSAVAMSVFCDLSPLVTCCQTLRDS